VPVNRKMWLHLLILILLWSQNFAQLSNDSILKGNFSYSCHSSYDECKSDHRSSDMFRAARNGFCKCLEIFLDMGEEVDYHPPNIYKTPLFDAAIRGHVKCMELLIDRGANVSHVNPIGSSPLYHAAIFGNCKGVQLLIERGAIVDYKVRGEETALSGAAGSGHVLCVKALVDAGANVHDQNKCSKTMLA